MNKIEEIRERFDRGYTMTLYGTRENLHKQMNEDIQFLLNLFSAENRAIENQIEVVEDRIKFINASDSTFKGSMSASKELHRLRGIKKTLKELL